MQKVARGSTFPQAQCCRQMQDAHEDAATGRIIFLVVFCMLPQHLANIIIVLLWLERQTCACVELALVWACLPIPELPLTPLVSDTLRPPQAWASRGQVTAAQSLTAGARPDG